MEVNMLIIQGLCSLCVDLLSYLKRKAIKIMSKLKRQNSRRESCFPRERNWIIVVSFCILCSSASCIRIRLLTAAAPACHANCRTLLPIYIGAARRDVCTQLPIYQTHAQSASPRPQAAFSGATQHLDGLLPQHSCAHQAPSTPMRTPTSSP